MLHGEAFGLLVGAVALGAIHGVEPGHGWPVAASYALDQSNKWLYGFAASAIIGLGHLLSSIAMVAVFFYAKSYFDLTQVNDPVTVGPVEIGGPVSIVAGVVLVALGVREYTHGHSHGHGGGHEGHSHGDDRSHGDDGHSHDSDHDRSHGDDGHSHDGDHDRSHGDDGHHLAPEHGADGRARTIDTDDEADERHTSHDHQHGHDHEHAGHDHASDDGLLARVTTVLPLVGGRSHDHGDLDEATDRGLWGIAWFAFLLGFAHEEEFEIIALCAGSTHCLELMSAYALTVITFIVLLTLSLIAGYHRFEERVEAYTDYLPAFSAAVLVVMGTGFVLGLF